MVLLVALIVLVAITVAGIALIRSVDTTTLVAGNLAFQQAAIHASDTGVEAAIAVLKQRSADDTLNIDDETNGYFATLNSSHSPAARQSWQDFWQADLATRAYDMGTDQFGNRVYFVIHRQCAQALPPGAGGQCVASPASTSPAGNSEEAGEVQLEGSSKVYYRITVRVSGPRRTESYVQTHVSM
jgi:hypothetical protein